MTKVYLFDIDGTLSDARHRLHHIQKEPKDWDAFFVASASDPPIPHMIKMLHDLAKDAEIIFVSGRSDQVRAITTLWLKVQFPTWEGWDKPFLYMRKAGDHRPDYVVKGELLDQILADGYEPIMAFDDRTQVVKMWRERGIPCAQVAEGDF